MRSWPIGQGCWRGLLGLLLLLLPALGKAQTVSSIIRQFEVQDGLSHRAVYSILEDPKGFIWLGSEKSLQRFDGHSFTTWTQQQDHPLLQDIYLLGIDRQGWLWMHNNTDRKFLFFHTETEQFQTAEERFGPSSPISDSSKGIGTYGLAGLAPIDSRGRMVFPVSEPRQVVYYDARTGFSTVRLSSKIEIGSALFAVDGQDDLWFISPGDQAQIYRVGNDGMLKSQQALPGCRDVHVLHRSDREVTLWVEGAGGSNFVRIKLPSGDVQVTAAGEETWRLWANGFEMRLLPGRWEVWDTTGNAARLQAIATEKYKPSYYKGIKLSYLDSKGRVWLGGDWGLTSWDVRPGRFKRHLWFEEDEEKPFNNSVRGIYADGQTLYANLESVGVVAMPLSQPGQWEYVDRDMRGQDNRNTFLSSRPLIRLRNGSLELAQSATLINLDPATGLKHVTPLDDKTFWHIWSLHEDKRGRIWVGGEGVLGMLRPDGSMEVTELWPGNKIWKVVYQFLDDGQGRFWLSTNSGLLLFDPEQRKIVETYGKEQTGDHHLPSSAIHHHHIDAEGLHWLATDAGLVQWNPHAQAVQSWTTMEGLSSNVVYGVFEDRASMLWLSSDYGLMRFNKRTHDVRTYLENEGISHTEFNRISWFQAADGTIYFGGMNGITSFQPGDFAQEQASQPVIQITGFEVFDRQENKVLNRVGELRATRTITFGREIGYIRIQFAIPNPFDENLVLYAWRLKENGSNWAYQSDNFLQFANLGYGTHTLQVMGRDHTGIWSAPIEIRLHVPRPFYLQAWFIVLIAALALLVAMLVFRRRTQILRRRQLQLEHEIEVATARILEDKQTIARQMEELQQLDEAKSRFFANVAHEFRTPLTLIHGPLSSVLKSKTLSQEHLRLLQMARENTNNLTKMIADLLDLTKMESGKMQLHVAPLHLQPWLHQLAGAFEALMEVHGISFECEVAVDPGFVFDVDREKLHTILKNLLSNALKFTPKGHKIRLAAQADSSEVVITVRDTGRGIHPDDLPFIFDRFYQTRQDGAPVEGGTGIGLALCREFTRLMQGQLTVDSELGQGTCFTLRLPAHHTASEAPTAEEADSMNEASGEASRMDAPAQPLTPSTVLVVEDNPTLQDYLKFILSPTYTVRVAPNGREALDLLMQLHEAELPDLLISDVMMPEMDGFQLLAAVKGDSRLGHLPMIMLTARVGVEDRLRALKIGVDDYLTKPFEEEELLTRVANLLRNSAMRRLAREEGEGESVESDGTQPTKEDTESQSELPVIGAIDRSWLDRLEEAVKAQLRHETLSVTQLSSDFAMSESTFRRQVKRLTGLSPQEYLTEHKLNRARQLLETREVATVAQAAEEVGYVDAKAFARSFKNRFGRPPSGFLG